MITVPCVAVDWICTISEEDLGYVQQHCCGRFCLLREILRQKHAAFHALFFCSKRSQDGSTETTLPALQHVSNFILIVEVNKEIIRGKHVYENRAPANRHRLPALVQSCRYSERLCTHQKQRSNLNNSVQLLSEDYKTQILSGEDRGTTQTPDECRFKPSVHLLIIF